jgi:hypothetical protein
MLELVMQILSFFIFMLTSRSANIYKYNKLYMTSPWRRGKERIEGAIRLFETIGPSTERPNL